MKNILTKLLLLFTLSSPIYGDALVLNGLSYHYNRAKESNEFNYGLGYIKSNNEFGFYRNSRIRENSYSVYYTYNEELYTLSKLNLGYKVGLAYYDDKGSYTSSILPIVAGYADYTVTSNSKVRITGSYNVIGLQLIVKSK